ncbi:protein phosphatase 2c [Pseudozyma hubeiensis SY62]|uniref:Protein phosphatase 2c n=1 Tax=Pseudozyma hubeiensis (strain SY62) TaxID=1305764 RepID=R9PLE1_PSEHS|nr:protein phosphatase 2c [Pseudozyma hubeiensis SY62]GAC98900.1 protein phosphatase 2c [Pseudozyma hubeiensis SY62]
MADTMLLRHDATAARYDDDVPNAEPCFAIPETEGENTEGKLGLVGYRSFGRSSSAGAALNDTGTGGRMQQNKVFGGLYDVLVTAE